MDAICICFAYAIQYFLLLPCFLVMLLDSCIYYEVSCGPDITSLLTLEVPLDDS